MEDGLLAVRRYQLGLLWEATYLVPARLVGGVAEAVGTAAPERGPAGGDVAAGRMVWGG